MLCYLGPGGLLSGIGSFLALLAAVVLALLGFVWYPIKRMLRARKATKNGVSEAGSPVAKSDPSGADSSNSENLESKVEV
jgi:hypothetical protein